MAREEMRKRREEKNTTDYKRTQKPSHSRLVGGKIPVCVQFDDCRVP